MKLIKNYGLPVVALVIAIIALFTPALNVQKYNSVGSVVNNSSNYDALGVSTISVGTNCNNGQQMQNGNCRTTISAPTVAVVSGTTTPCAIPTPSATSTLISFSFIATTGTSTAATVTLATSTTAYATTSSIMSISSFTSSVLPNALSWEGGQNNTIVYPSTYVVMGEAGVAGTGGFVQSGYCTATFQTII